MPIVELISRLFPMAVEDAGVQALNTPTLILLGVVLAALAIAYGVGQILKRQPDSSVNPAIVQTFNSRIRAWWMMCAILVATFLIPGTWATVLLFGIISFWALRLRGPLLWDTTWPPVRIMKESPP